MILFMHGLLSNRIINTKYKNIRYENKICKTVHYHRRTYDEVSSFYDTLIKIHKPKLIVGHSMGGYWSIIKSNEHNIPCVALNPYITPNRFGTFYDYNNLTEKHFNSNVNLHLESGDMLLDMDEIRIFAEMNNCNYQFLDGGSHFIKYTDKMNDFIELIIGDLDEKMYCI